MLGDMFCHPTLFWQLLEKKLSFEHGSKQNHCQINKEVFKGFLPRNQDELLF